MLFTIATRFTWDQILNELWWPINIFIWPHDIIRLWRSLDWRKDADEIYCIKTNVCFSETSSPPLYGYWTQQGIGHTIPAFYSWTYHQMRFGLQMNAWICVIITCSFFPWPEISQVSCHLGNLKTVVCSLLGYVLFYSWIVSTFIFYKLEIICHKREFVICHGLFLFIVQTLLGLFSQ